MLEVQELVKLYGSVRAVDRLSFQVHRGRITGLLGPNGAGKTTTFNIICRFLKATEGRVLIDGVELDRFSQLKARIQALPQDARLPDDVPIWRQLAFYARLQGMSASDAETAAKSVLERVGLADKLEQRAKALSHGMHQRAAMAQAFLGNPELILLDEPTSGLDPRRAAEARQIITDLRGGTSVLISSHNLAEIQAICDDVVIIDRGRLVYQGSVADLTGQAAEFKVWVRASSSPAELAQGVAGVKEAIWLADESALEVTCEPDVDDAVVLSDVLRALLGQGVVVTNLQRGRSLEERFLRLTEEGELQEASEPASLTASTAT